MINLSLPSGAMAEEEREMGLPVGKPLAGVIDQLPIDPELDEPVIPDRYLIGMPAVEIAIAIRTPTGLDISVFINQVTDQSTFFMERSPGPSKISDIIIAHPDQPVRPDTETEGVRVPGEPERTPEPGVAALYRDEDITTDNHPR